MRLSEFMKGAKIKGRPGYALRPVKARDGKQTRRWVRVGPKGVKVAGSAGKRQEQAIPQETRDPKEEYARLGTRAPAFKQWFGDWEKDPENASKVVDAKTGEPKETYDIPGDGSKVTGKDGKPIVVYHGTAHGGFRSFDKEKQVAESLYGPGFYFTEDNGVAAEYQKKGENPFGAVRDGGPWEPDNDDALRAEEFVQKQAEESGPLSSTWRHLSALMEGWRTPRQALMRCLQAVFGDDASHDERMAGRELAHELGVEFGSVGEVKSLFLNIRNPVDVEKADPALAEAIVRREGDRLGHWTKEQWKTNLAKAAADPRTAIERDLQARNVPRVALWYRKRGYDGITHIGGDRMGGGHHHRVWIAFEPEQVKAVENEGTFNPQEADIYKSLTDKPNLTLEPGESAFRAYLRRLSGGGEPSPVRKGFATPLT